MKKGSSLPVYECGWCGTRTTRSWRTCPKCRRGSKLDPLILIAPGREPGGQLLFAHCPRRRVGQPCPRCGEKFQRLSVHMRMAHGAKEVTP